MLSERHLGLARRLIQRLLASSKCSYECLAQLEALGRCERNRLKLRNPFDDNAPGRRLRPAARAELPRAGFIVALLYRDLFSAIRRTTEILSDVRTSARSLVRLPLVRPLFRLASLNDFKKLTHLRTRPYLKPIGDICGVVVVENSSLALSLSLSPSLSLSLSPSLSLAHLSFLPRKMKKKKKRLPSKCFATNEFTDTRNIQ